MKTLLRNFRPTQHSFSTSKRMSAKAAYVIPAGGLAFLLSAAVNVCYADPVPQSEAGPSGVAQRIALQTNIPKEKAEEQVEAVFTAIQAELKAGKEVPIRSFGKFYVSERKEHAGRNPKTGAPLQIPAKKYPKFNSAEGLKRSINEG